jgi:hypothetical protein
MRVAHGLTWRQTRRPAGGFAATVAEDLAPLGDGVQVARLVPAHLSGAQVSSDADSGGVSSMPSSGSRISSSEVCRQCRVRPIMVVGSCKRGAIRSERHTQTAES